MLSKGSLLNELFQCELHFSSRILFFLYLRAAISTFAGNSAHLAMVRTGLVAEVMSCDMPDKGLLYSVLLLQLLSTSSKTSILVFELVLKSCRSKTEYKELFVSFNHRNFGPPWPYWEKYIREKTLVSCCFYLLFSIVCTVTLSTLQA